MDLHQEQAKITIENTTILERKWIAASTTRCSTSPGELRPDPGNNRVLPRSYLQPSLNAEYRLQPNSRAALHFVSGIIKPKDGRLKYEEKAIRLIPSQFLYEDGTVYERVLGVLDYVCGMTDNYAADLYKKIKGIDIG